MKLKERLQNARKRIHKLIFRLPVSFYEDVFELAEAVQDARQGGFTDAEVDELLTELRRLLAELKALREAKP
jgi:hypothetical protein